MTTTHAILKQNNRLRSEDVLVCTKARCVNPPFLISKISILINMHEKFGKSLYVLLRPYNLLLDRATAGVTVPIMAMVPVITLLLGYFPIALNFNTVVAITAYYFVLNALTFYCSSLREYKAIWLSNTATTIFWCATSRIARVTEFGKNPG